MNVVNLEHLLEMLQDIHKDIKMRKHFNLESWATLDKKNLCGTTFCAMGYAANYPFFMKQGLLLEYNYIKFNQRDGIEISNSIKANTPNNFARILKMDNHPDVVGDFNIKLNRKIRKGYTEYLNGFGAINRLFDISSNSSSILFSISSYMRNNRGVNRVIDRIKYLLKCGETKFIAKYGEVYDPA